MQLGWIGNSSLDASDSLKIFPLPVIAKLLDHESLDTTEIYAETDAEMINAAFAAAEEIRERQDGKIPEEKRWKRVDEETLAKLYSL